jgi:hypothetical protein
MGIKLILLIVAVTPLASRENNNSFAIFTISLANDVHLD